MRYSTCKWIVIIQVWKKLSTYLYSIGKNVINKTKHNACVIGGVGFTAALEPGKHHTSHSTAACSTADGVAQL